MLIIRIYQRILRFIANNKYPSQVAKANLFHKALNGLITNTKAPCSHSETCITPPFIKPTLSLKKVLFVVLCSVIFSASAFTQVPQSKTDQPFFESPIETQKKLPVCLYIASYAPGYPWQNGIERGIRQSLNDKCELKTFFMNTKQVFKESELEKIGVQAIDFIASNNPDVVIVSDDNATKYVLEKHYKNSRIPFVFCGVNNTGSTYNLPYKNTTGMIEKNPTEYLLKLLFNISPSKTRVAFLTSNGTTAKKDVIEFNQLADQLGIKHQAYQIQDENEWRKVYKKVQESDDIDLIYFSNRAAFNTWDHQKNIDWALQHNHKLSFTTQDWMMPYVAVGINKIPDEQGVWAGQAALEILKGTPPSEIAVVPNQNFQLWINKEFARPFKKELPENVFSKSIIYDAKVAH